MARLHQPKTPDDIKSLSVKQVKVEYNNMAEDYNKVINYEVCLCHKCGEWKNASTGFYASQNTKTGIEDFACKECILDMCTDVDKKTKIRTDNKQKTIDTFRQLNWYFNDAAYMAQVRSLAENVNEKMRSTAAVQWIVMCRSLPQWRGKTFADSEFDVNDLENNTEENTKIVQKTLKAGRKRFGNTYTNDDLMFLENEYQDWISRYECNTKAQEDLFEMLAINKWEKRKAIRDGKSTKDLDRTYQDLLSSINILPRQNSANGVSDSLTFGQLIERWEENEPIPEPSDEFKDVDNIGKYIRVWFKGHLCRALGIDNGYSHEYDEYVKDYIVTKPEFEEDGKSETIYSTIFGKDET